jgi:hypothetical protein
VVEGDGDGSGPRLPGWARGFSQPSSGGATGPIERGDDGWWKIGVVGEQAVQQDPALVGGQQAAPDQATVEKVAFGAGESTRHRRQALPLNPCRTLGCSLRNSEPRRSCGTMPTAPSAMR